VWAAATEPGRAGQLCGRISPERDREYPYARSGVVDSASYRISAEPVDFSGGFPAAKARRS
jgi:hypothetical protein